MSKAPPGFVIHSIELDGFMRYKDPTKVSFPGQFTAITGPTGSGKTSILDAMTFALYGTSSRTDERMKIEDFVEKDGHVRLKFYQGGQLFEVTRGRKNGRNYVAFSQNLRAIGGSTSEIQQEIINTVGLDYVGFRNSTFIRQDEMKAIGSDTGAQRLDIFQRLFRLEVFEKAQKIAEERLKEARESAIRASTRMQQMTETYEKTLPLKREELKAAEASAKEMKKRSAELKEKAKETEKQVSKLQPLHEAYSKVSEATETARREIDDNKKKIDSAEGRNKQRQKLVDELSNLKKAADDYSRLSQKVSTLALKEQKASGIEEKIAIHRENIAKIKKSFQTQAARYQKRLSEYQKRLKSVKIGLGKDEAFNLLRLEGALRERIERIDMELGWLKEKQDLVQQLRKEKLQTSDKLPEVSRQTNSITEDVFLKTEVEENVKQADAELNELRNQVDRQTRDEELKIGKLARDFRTVGFSKLVKNKLTQMRQELKRLESEASEYSKKQERLEDLPDQRALIRELRLQMAKFQKSLEDLTKQESRLREHEKRYSTLMEELGGLQKKITEAVRGAAEASGKLDALREQVREIEKMKPEIERLGKETNELLARQEIYTTLKEEIFHRKGVLIYAINQLLQSIGREASLILGDLTDKRLNDIRVSPYTDTKGGGVRIEVEGVDGLFHDVSTFSGGEKTQVNAALRFAIAKELASMPQVGKSYGNMKTLFIDEGDLGSLDTEQSRKLFVRKLFSLGNLFQKIILITHITEVADDFPSRIRVTMTPEQFSKTVEVTTHE